MYYLLNNGLIVSDKSEFVYIHDNNRVLVYVTDEYLRKHVMRGTRTKYIFRDFGNIIKRSETLSKFWDFKIFFSLGGVRYGNRLTK